jgi:CDP-paratose 2-epimerase
MKTLLVTGAAGLVGSEVVERFCRNGWQVIGLDNNHRMQLFGIEADTRRNSRRLLLTHPNFQLVSVDVRDHAGVAELVARQRPDAIVHAAAQPSHDLAAQMPVEDFEINALGTLHLLESARAHCPEAPFVFVSTNKVYGDRPNDLPWREFDTRFEFDGPLFRLGIDETLDIDQSLHSLFGVSKASADLMVQEYGRYFGMPTMTLRGGCLTGTSHAGVELHGFLSYLAKCVVSGRPYAVFGYGGKQVRDNLDARDLAHLIELMIDAPRVGAVYNVGGGYSNSISILEAINTLASLAGTAPQISFREQARVGDHRVYYTDLTRVHLDFPAWRVTVSVQSVLEDLVTSWQERLSVETA